jgi:hypothetical protein
MAIAEGKHGKITVRTIVVTTSTAGDVYTPTPHTIAEMGTWSVGGQNRDMIEYTAFGDTVKKWKPGMLDPGTITFSGFWDGTDSTGQRKLLEAFTSGVAIDNTTERDKLGKLRLWANDDISLSNYGFWSCTGSSGKIYITSIDLGQDKNGLATVSFTAKVSDGYLEWSTST